MSSHESIMAADEYVQENSAKSKLPFIAAVRHFPSYSDDEVILFRSEVIFSEVSNDFGMIG